MSGTSFEPAKRVWDRLVAAHQEFALAHGEFLAEGVDRAGLVRAGLRAHKMMDVATALYVMGYLNVPERMQLLEELVELSLHHGLAMKIRELIRSLPRDYVLANVERIAEPLLEKGDYDEYRRFLELYLELDRELTLKLARRAAAHPDADVQEAGQEFLEELGANGVASPAAGARPAS